MTLLVIVLGTLLAGIGSVWLAAWLSFGVISHHTRHMLSLAAGALLATAFLHLLPEALDQGGTADRLFATLLVGLVFFFLLDKAELWHHGHEHHHGQHGPEGHDSHLHEQGHTHAHAHTHNHNHAHDSLNQRSQGQTTGSWAVLAGDSVHCFGDGILMASAFMADVHLGLLAALAVLAHEVPHHMGDLVVLRQVSGTRQAAVLKVSLAGAVTALGGIVGYLLVDALHDLLPYFLAIASSSFIYVALADLIPQLQKRLSARETAAQVLWLGLGVGMVMLFSLWTHGGHAH